MDNWKKYIQENEENLSIEEVDDKVWQHVYKKAVPKKRFLFTRIKTAFADLFNQYAFKNEGYGSKRGNSKVRLAYAFVLAAFVIVSCTYKVKSYTTYGDMVTFALTKNSYLLNNESHATSVFTSFSRIASPSDSSSFLFFTCIKKENPEARKIISNLKGTSGIADLVITPIVLEFKESLFSSFVYKAFEIKITDAKPDIRQVKNKIKNLLKEKGLNSVEVQIEEKSQAIQFSVKTMEEHLPLSNTKDSLSTTNVVGDSIMMTSRMDTTKPNKDVSTKMPNLNLPGWKKELALTTELMKALEKDGLVDNKYPYELEIKEGEFYINGKKQSKEITEKYRRFFRNDNYTIQNDGDQPKTTPSVSESLKDQQRTLPKKEIDNAKFDPVKYKKDLQMMNLLIDGLVQEGLIDRNKPYTVNIKEGELYVDNKKQPKEVSDKFRKYFTGNNYGFIND